MKLLFSVFILFVYVNLYADQSSSKIDSIRQVLSGIKDVNSRFDKCLRIAKDEQNRTDRLAIMQILNADNYELLDTIKANHLYYLCETHLRLNNDDSVKYYNKRVYEFGANKKLYVFQLRALAVTAQTNAIGGHLDSAIYYYKIALDIVDEMYKDPINPREKVKLYQADILGNLSGIFFNLNDFESAKKYVLESEEICNEYNLHESSVYNLIRLGMIERSSNNLNEALNYHIKAIEKLKIVKDSSLLLFNFVNIGRIELEQNHLQNSIIYFEKAEKLAFKIDNMNQYFDILNEKVKIYIQQGKLVSAEIAGKEMLSFASQNSLVLLLSTSYNRLYDIEVAKGNFKKALDYRNEHYTYRDSISNTETKNKVNELKTIYETAKKEAEIENLSLSNNLKEAEINRAETRQIAIIIISLLLILLLVIFVVLRSKKLKAEKEAQSLQMEALQKRFIELHSSPSEIAVALEMAELNEKLYTPLTSREFDVLKLSIEGKTNVEIGDILHISISTVKFHLRNTYSKMGVKNRKEAFQQILKSS